MAYLLDSNVFIEAKRLHYGFDFCPAFWDWIDQRRYPLQPSSEAFRMGINFVIYAMTH